MKMKMAILIIALTLFTVEVSAQGSPTTADEVCIMFSKPGQPADVWLHKGPAVSKFLSIQDQQRLLDYDNNLLTLHKATRTSACSGKSFSVVKAETSVNFAKERKAMGILSTWMTKVLENAYKQQAAEQAVKQ